MRMRITVSQTSKGSAEYRTAVMDADGRVPTNWGKSGRGVQKRWEVQKKECVCARKPFVR